MFRIESQEEEWFDVKLYCCIDFLMIEIIQFF